uniref:Uncharacterized protein n=1 Tax=Populus alba TaxID=43335 RepID=A0A4U5Q9D1_POPAL|nr:hypothetical protein D5086_0000116690 [Populus alba]
MVSQRITSIFRWIQRQRGTGVGEWEGGIDEGSDDGSGKEDDDDEGCGGDEGGEGDVWEGSGKGEEGVACKEFGKAGGVIVFDREPSGVGEKELVHGMSRATIKIGP